MPNPQEEIIHASCVAMADRALLIRGGSRSGKSSLALDLISRGAAFVSDDRTVLRRVGDGVDASAPAPLAGRIEARGIGLLNAPFISSARVVAVVELDQVEPERLPPHRMTRVMGLEFPLILVSEQTCFPAALVLYLVHGRSD